MTELEIDITAGPVRVVPVLATAADVLLINGPCQLCGWSLANVGATPTSADAIAAFAAAGNGTATLALGEQITGFDVSYGQTTAANTATVTVTGAVGGTLTYTVLFEGTGTQTPDLIIRFPQPLAPANPLVGIAVTFTGNANSPAGTIIAYGPASLTVAQAEIQDGNNPLGEILLSVASSDTHWYGGAGLWVRNRLNLHLISGTVVGAVYVRYAKLTG
jgi:hypothetical protein